MYDDGVPFEGEDHQTPTLEEGACRWCMSGAIFAAMRELGYPSVDQHGPQYAARWQGFSHAWRRANNITLEDPVDTIVEYNDYPGRTKSEVLESLRRMT